MTKPIEQYRKEVDNRPFESNSEHRQRVGGVSRYVHIKNRDVPHWIRAREVKEYKEMCIRVEEKVQAHIATLPTTKEKWFATQAPIDQYLYDTSSHPYYVDRRERAIREMRRVLVEIMDIPAAASDLNDSQVEDLYSSNLIKIQEEE